MLIDREASTNWTNTLGYVCQVGVHCIDTHLHYISSTIDQSVVDHFFDQCSLIDRHLDHTVYYKGDRSKTFSPRQQK